MSSPNPEQPAPTPRMKQQDNSLYSMYQKEFVELNEQLSVANGAAMRAHAELEASRKEVNEWATHTAQAYVKITDLERELAVLKHALFPAPTPATSDSDGPSDSEADRDCILRALQHIAPWTLSNDMTWADEIICGLHGVEEELVEHRARLAWMDQHWHDWHTFITTDSEGWIYKKEPGVWYEGNFVTCLRAAMAHAGEQKT